ncbi:MAG: GNAT family protein [Bacteroidales bacterium]|nr:GNAT family protein [Bacteroidales bacterium]
MNTQQIRLRKWEMSDLESLITYANNANIANNLTDVFPHPYTKADGECFITMVQEDDPVKVFAIEIDGKACGAIGIFPQPDIHKKNAEMGYWLAEPFWGKGIMTKLIGEMIAYGFTTWDIDRIFARPFGSNLASQQILRKNGMKLEARLDQTLWKNNRYEDELIFAIRRNDLYNKV